MYLQKFDVNDDRSNDLFWHQYMTNCLAPYSESKSIYNAYSNSNLLNSSIGFVIPVYENMPQYATSSPAINLSDFQDDNTRVYANVTTTLNVRTGPGTAYERLISIPANQTFTRIGKGVQNGERWDKVLLDNGMVGYVFQTYVDEYIEEVPDEPTTEDIYFELDKSIILNESEISGVDMLTVGEFKELINTNLVVEFYDNSGTLLNDSSLIGTGYRLCVKNDNDVEIYNYYFIMYGDVNGDADINALDVLVLQKYILEIRQLDGLFLKAGNISKNGEVPNSLDVLKIQKHILEIKFIEQGKLLKISRKEF